MPNPSSDFESALQAQARRTAARMVKSRARAYLRRPIALDSLSPGLASAGPKATIAAAIHLLEKEKHRPRRWWGFGGETPTLNARAALLLGRALRRAQRHEAQGPSAQVEGSAAQPNLNRTPKPPRG
ncbi:hypothetical protein [Methylocapsa acidiphila]|uniref:hypothetical protein n=1 Tax=Methylocapsa acidiphila TaxID=133552 RepID=UPI000410D1C0|nr:hypothetical protein [Methylocapsa acidiphila]